MALRRSPIRIRSSQNRGRRRTRATTRPHIEEADASRPLFFGQALLALLRTDSLSNMMSGAPLRRDGGLCKGPPHSGVTGAGSDEHSVRMPERASRKRRIEAAPRPSGTIAFLFSDIEGSTKRWESHPEAMQIALRRHDELIKAAIAAHDGHIFKTIGDAYCAAFHRVPEAVAAALAAQRAVGSEDWSDIGGLAVRMAVHAGLADERDGDYFGPTVNRVARLLSIAHGGQIVLSSAAAGLIKSAPSARVALRDLGPHRLRDLANPEQVYQVLADDLRKEFPALRSADSLPNNLPLQL